MATGKRFYWIKLKESFLNSDAVDFLMSQTDGANYVVLYQILCLKTINTGGKLERRIGEVIIPYDEEKIQRDAKWFTIDTVRVALNLYKALGLIYQDENGILTLADYGNIVGSETSWKEQKRLQRAKNLPELKECKRLNENMIRLPTGQTQYVDEKRYGGNGMLAYDLAGGKCEMCGSYDDLLIHHGNGYSNEPEDLYVLCKTCHGKAHSPSTQVGWLHHSWIEEGQDGGQGGGQEGGHVHPDIDIRDKILDIDNRDIEKRDKEKREEDTARSRFIPPTVEEVAAYCEERGNGINPQKFVDYYTSNGWMRGKTKIKDWKACVRTWEGKNNDGRKQHNANGKESTEPKYHYDVC